MDSWVGSCQIMKNQTNLDLIQITQFSLKIYELCRHPHLWLGVWIGGWMARLMGWGYVK